LLGQEQILSAPSPVSKITTDEVGVEEGGEGLFHPLVRHTSLSSIGNHDSAEVTEINNNKFLVISNVLVGVAKFKKPFKQKITKEEGFLVPRKGGRTSSGTLKRYASKSSLGE
jgi:hypothetical protein